MLELLPDNYVIYRHSLDLLKYISGEAVLSILKQRIKTHVECTCQGNFEVEHYESLHKASLDVADRYRYIALHSFYDSLS